MPHVFRYDVFLSHSSRDKAIVRTVADRLRKDGLRVWFDEWEIKGGDSIPAKIEEALEHSRIMVLCMSSNAFGSDWPQLESATFRFRDPLNKERRFILLRLDDAPIKRSLAQLVFVTWLPPKRDQQYAKLLEACRPEQARPDKEGVPAPIPLEEWIVPLKLEVFSFAFSPDGKHGLTGSDNRVRLWDLKTNRCLRVLRHIGEVRSVALCADGRHALSGSDDNTVRLWDLQTGLCLRVHRGNAGEFATTTVGTHHGRLKYVIADSKGLRCWEIGTLRSVWALRNVETLVWSIEGDRALTAGYDNQAQLWDLKRNKRLGTLKGHSDWVTCFAWGINAQLVLSSRTLGFARKEVRQQGSS